MIAADAVVTGRFGDPASRRAQVQRPAAVGLAADDCWLLEVDVIREFEELLVDSFGRVGTQDAQTGPGRAGSRSDQSGSGMADSNAARGDSGKAWSCGCRRARRRRKGLIKGQTENNARATVPTRQLYVATIKRTSGGNSELPFTLADVRLMGTPFPSYLSEHMRTIVYKVPGFIVREGHFPPVIVHDTCDFRAAIVTDLVTYSREDDFSD